MITNEEPDSTLHSPECPIFICYRQVDGKDAAEWIYNALHGQHLTLTHGSHAKPHIIKVYYDQVAPAVGDWTEVQKPALQRARALILVCSPGAYSRIGEHDWVHLELDWWIETRQTAPILIDPTGEGLRWTPESVKRRWPNAQQIVVRPQYLAAMQDAEKTMHEQRICDRIIQGILESEQQTIYEDLERERLQTQTLAELLSQATTTRALVRLSDGDVNGLLDLNDALISNPLSEESAAHLRGIWALKHEIHAESLVNIIESDQVLSNRGLAIVRGMIAVAYAEKVYLWKVDERTPRHEFDLGEPCEGITVSPKSSLLAIWANHSIQVRDADFNELARNPAASESGIKSVAITPEGLIISIDRKAGIRFFRLPELDEQDGSIAGDYADIALDSRGSILAVGSNDGFARVYHVASRQPMGDALPHDSRVWKVALDGAGRRLASGTESGDIYLWKWDGEFWNKITVFQERSGIRNLTFSDDDASLLWTSFDTVKSVNLDDWKVTWSWRAPTRIMDMILTEDNRYVVLASDGSPSWVVRRAMSTLPYRKIFFGAATGLAFSPDGTLLAVPGNSMVLWDTQTWKPTRRLELDGTAIGCTFSGEGKNLFAYCWASSSGNEIDISKITTWDVASGKGDTTMFDGMLMDMSPAPNSSIVGMAFWKGQERKALGLPSGVVVRRYDNANAVAYNKEGTCVAFAIDKSINVLNVDTDTPVCKPMRHASVTSLAFSSDGSLLASASQDATVRIWDLREEKLIGPPLRHEAKVWNTTFDPLGRFLATLTELGVVTLWDFRTSTIVHELKEAAGQLSTGGDLELWLGTTVFSPDGRFLASNSRHGGVVVWSLPFSPKDPDEIRDWTWVDTGRRRTAEGIVEPMSAKGWRELRRDLRADSGKDDPLNLERLHQAIGKPLNQVFENAQETVRANRESAGDALDGMLLRAMESLSDGLAIHGVIHLLTALEFWVTVENLREFRPEEEKTIGQIVGYLKYCVPLLNVDEVDWLIENFVDRFSTTLHEGSSLARMVLEQLSCVIFDELEQHGKAIDIQQTLYDRFPDDPYTVLNVAEMHLAAALLGTASLSEADRSIDRAISVSEEMNMQLIVAYLLKIVVTAAAGRSTDNEATYAKLGLLLDRTSDTDLNWEFNRLIAGMKKLGLDREVLLFDLLGRVKKEEQLKFLKFIVQRTLEEIGYMPSVE